MPKQPPQLISVSATAQFEFPQFEEYLSHPVPIPTKAYAILRYNLTGTAIEANVPLRLNITLTVPHWAINGIWAFDIASIDVTDAVVANQTTGKPIEPLEPVEFVINQQLNSSDGDMILSDHNPLWMNSSSLLFPQDTVVFTSSGYVGGLTTFPLSPDPSIKPIINMTRLPDYFTSYDMTQIYIQPYGTAETQAQNQKYQELTNSLTYIILFFASIEISTHFFENSTKKESPTTEKHNNDIKTQNANEKTAESSPSHSVKDREPHSN